MEKEIDGKGRESRAQDAASNKTTEETYGTETTYVLAEGRVGRPIDTHALLARIAKAKAARAKTRRSSAAPGSACATNDLETCVMHCMGNALSGGLFGTLWRKRTVRHVPDAAPKVSRDKRRRDKRARDDDPARDAKDKVKRRAKRSRIDTIMASSESDDKAVAVVAKSSKRGIVSQTSQTAKSTPSPPNPQTPDGVSPQETFGDMTPLIPPVAHATHESVSAGASVATSPSFPSAPIPRDAPAPRTDSNLPQAAREPHACASILASAQEPEHRVEGDPNEACPATAQESLGPSVSETLLVGANADMDATSVVVDDSAIDHKSQETSGHDDDDGDATQTGLALAHKTADSRPFGVPASETTGASPDPLGGALADVSSKPTTRPVAPEKDSKAPSESKALLCLLRDAHRLLRAGGIDRFALGCRCGNVASDDGHKCTRVCVSRGSANDTFDVEIEGPIEVLDAVGGVLSGATAAIKAESANGGSKEDTTVSTERLAETVGEKRMRPILRNTKILALYSKQWNLSTSRGCNGVAAPSASPQDSDVDAVKRRRRSLHASASTSENCSCGACTCAPIQEVAIRVDCRHPALALWRMLDAPRTSAAAVLDVEVPLLPVLARVFPLTSL